MGGRDYVGLAATVLEEGVKALVPGAGPLVGVASRALEPEKDQLRQWRTDKAERRRYSESVTVWARGKEIGDADIEDGMAVAADMLRQKGASMQEVANLNLDAQQIAAVVMARDQQPEKELSSRHDAQRVCGYAVLVFYMRLVESNRAALERAVGRVLLERTDEIQMTTQGTHQVATETLDLVQALPDQVATAMRTAHPALRSPTGPVVVGDLPSEPPGFVQRDMLGALEAALARSRVVVLWGLRGSGKSQLAAAHARARIADGWSLVGWVDAEAESTLLAGLARVAEAQAVADPNGDSAASAQRLRDYLNTRAEPALLVLDNATEPDRVRPLLPAGGVTQVLITTTDRNFSELGEPVGVEPYSLNEAVGFLEERTGLGDPDGAAALAEALGRLPLALAQAAPVIRRRRLSYSAYLQRLREVPVEGLLGPIKGQPYTRSTAAALLMGVEQVESMSLAGPNGLAPRVLRVVALLSPIGVDRDWLSPLEPGDESNHQSFPGPDVASWVLDEAIDECVSASLLDWSAMGSTLLMHRLLARVIRDRDEARGGLDDSAMAAWKVLTSQAFEEQSAWERRAIGAVLVQHIESLWESAAKVWDADPSAASAALALRNWGTRQLIAAADMTQAPKMARRVAKDSDRLLGSQHLGSFNARNNLALALEKAGRLDEAIPVYQDNLSKAEALWGTNHPNTQPYRNNLASAHSLDGRHDEAIVRLKAIFDAQSRTRPLRDTDVLRAGSELALAYKNAGKAPRAVELYERLLPPDRRVIPASEP